ncbi:ABC transporter permease [Teredinibacter haidensis]|uniref:ABC transporter permease n=1 Tax=Teredinibacter haidensis TaxID=2731755 RepID=UPI0009491831|nr:FtsX-like permease family protein [Teredinibacter haidensis]
MKSIFTLFWRDFRSGELNILIFSLLLATATVTSISLFTSRIQNSILDEATEFLAADAQIRSTLAIKQPWQEQASASGLQTANLATFRTMAFSNNGMQLVAIKAVSEQYPLKGAVTLSDQLLGKAYTASRAPAKGELWLTSRLFSALNIQVGESLTIGDASFIASRVLIKEPDSPQTFFGVAPRIIMHYADIEATNAIQVGSRVNYALLVSGNQKQVNQFKKWIEPELGNHARWIDVKDSNQNVGDALERAEKFLLLAGSLSVLLCGVAIALAARRYAIRQSPTVALLKTFGQTPTQILLRYLIVLVVLGCSSVLLGAMLGWILHGVILQLLHSLLPPELAAASLMAFFTGAIAGFVTLLAFAAPPLISLRNIPPAAVLRQGASNNIVSPRTASILGFTTITLLIFVYSKNIMITTVIALGGLITLIGGGLLAWLILAIAKQLSHKLNNEWRLGIANLKRHQGFNAIQIVIFSSILMLLLILIDTRTSLVFQWQKQLPEHAPNHFLFNIFNDEKPIVENLLKQAELKFSPFYPMTRGRITLVNGDSVKPRIETTESHMNYERELNLTWATTLGDDNDIIEGQWHGDKNEDLIVSAELEYARGLDLKVGDQLTFSVAGEKMTATLGSLRSVQWDSMNPNFFMIFSQPLLDNTATNWLTSVYLDPQNKTILNQLTSQVPTVSVVELDQMIKQVQSIIGQVSLAVEFILLLVLAAGTLVLITSVQATLDVRFQESAILRTLGAKRRLVLRVLIIEFTSLGFMAGLLASIGAQFSLYLLQTRIFQLEFSASPLVILLGPVAGALLIGTIGWLSTRKVTYQPPLTILRSLE